MGVQRDWVQKYDVDKSDRGNYAKMPRCHLARGVCAPARQGAELTPSSPFPCMFQLAGLKDILFLELACVTSYERAYWVAALRLNPHSGLELWKSRPRKVCYPASAWAFLYSLANSVENFCHGCIVREVGGTSRRPRSARACAAPSFIYRPTPGDLFAFVPHIWPHTLSDSAELVLLCFQFCLKPGFCLHYLGLGFLSPGPVSVTISCDLATGLFCDAEQLRGICKRSACYWPR
jgi:hypothetical protein